MIGSAIGYGLAWSIASRIEAWRKRARDTPHVSAAYTQGTAAPQNLSADMWRDYQILLHKASNGIMIEVIRNFRSGNSVYREPEVVRMVTLDTNPTTLSEDIAAAITKASLIK